MKQNEKNCQKNQELTKEDLEQVDGGYTIPGKHFPDDSPANPLNPLGYVGRVVIKPLRPRSINNYRVY